jgi:hypothetical protein
MPPARKPIRPTLKPKEAPRGRQSVKESPASKPKPTTGLHLGQSSTVPIPQQYQQWVYNTAANTGLPVSIIAAQITVESNWNPQAESPAGARGIAQFEPGTWEDLGCAGSWWSAYDSFVCYTKFMRQLIAQFHGNLRNVLAAYNAGPNNLPAGYGYADEIISMAGGGAAISAGGQAVGTIALPTLPSTSQDSWSDYINTARDNFNKGAAAMHNHAGSVRFASQGRLEHSDG